MPFTIHPMSLDRWPQVRRIYAEGIAGGNATFERQPPDWEAWNAGHLSSCRLLAREGDEVLGWVALSPVSGRCVYTGVAEVSVYVAEAARGRGIGRALLEQAIRESEAEGIWTLQAGIFPENSFSVALFQGCGFRLVGTRERLGKMGDTWRDVALYERRSLVTGTG